MMIKSPRNELFLQSSLHKSKYVCHFEIIERRKPIEEIKFHISCGQCNEHLSIIIQVFLLSISIS